MGSLAAGMATFDAPTGPGPPPSLAVLRRGELELVGPDGSSVLVVQPAPQMPFLVGRGQLGLPRSPKIHREHLQLLLLGGGPVGESWTVQKSGTNPIYICHAGSAPAASQLLEGRSELLDGDRIFFTFKKEEFSLLARKAAAALLPVEVAAPAVPAPAVPIPAVPAVAPPRPRSPDHPPPDRSERKSSQPPPKRPKSEPAPGQGAPVKQAASSSFSRHAGDEPNRGSTARQVTVGAAQARKAEPAAAVKQAGATIGSCFESVIRDGKMFDGLRFV